MDPDVLDLRDFYNRPLGGVVRRLLTSRIRARWRSVHGCQLMGLGFAVPYIGLFRGEASRLGALMPANQGAQVGVLDIRTNAIESPQQIADRIRKVVKAVPADKVTLSTDCGMKPLARMVAKLKLHALAEGAAIVRKEVAGV